MFQTKSCYMTRTVAFALGEWFIWCASTCLGCPEATRLRKGYTTPWTSWVTLIGKRGPSPAPQSDLSSCCRLLGGSEMKWARTGFLKWKKCSSRTENQCGSVVRRYCNIGLKFLFRSRKLHHEAARAMLKPSSSSEITLQLKEKRPQVFIWSLLWMLIYLNAEVCSLSVQHKHQFYPLYCKDLYESALKRIISILDVCD